MESDNQYDREKQAALFEALLNDMYLNKLKTAYYEIYARYGVVSAVIENGIVKELRTTIPKMFAGEIGKINDLIELRTNQIKQDHGNI